MPLLEVKIPPMGESITSGILAKWHVADGAVVKKDQPLFELETDKITVEVPALKAGVLAKRLRADRMAHGSLDLDMPETKIFVDPQGYADRLERIEHDESHQLIEEFMLAANEAVAKLIEGST